MLDFNILYHLFIYFLLKSKSWLISPFFLINTSNNVRINYLFFQLKNL